AACDANRIMRTAPMPKLGAMSTPTPGTRDSHRRTVSSRSLSKPVVPTTAWTPSSMQRSRLPMTASGWVKSTATCAAESASKDSGSSTSMLATRALSGASSTPRQPSVPIRPAAPSTATRISSIPASSGSPQRRRTYRWRLRAAPLGCSGHEKYGSGGQGELLLVVEGTDHGQRRLRRKNLRSDGSDVFQGHRADLRQDLLDRQQVAVHERAFAQAAH